MKSKFLKFFFVMSLCLIPSIGAYAVGSENADYTAPDASNSDSKDDCFDDSGLPTGKGYMDENGHITVGLWNCFTGDYYDTRYSLAFWSDHKYASYFFVQRKGSVNDYNYTLVSVDEDGNVVGSWIYGSGVLWSTITPGLGTEWAKRQCSTPFTLFRPAPIDGSFSTNMPIYDASSDDYEDAVQRYIKNGDMSGAENYEEVSDEAIDGSIEVPHGLKISGEFSFGTVQKVFHNKLLTFAWTTPEQEDLTFDAQFKFNYKDGSTDKDSSWYDWRKNIGYNYDSSHYILDVVDKVDGVNWLSSARTSLGLNMDDCNYITFRVRNRRDNKISNWVEITLNQDGSASARETDTKGNTQDSSEYNEDTNPSTNDDNPGTNDFYDWVKDNTDNANNSNSDTGGTGLTSSINSIKSFIISGFGLLGSNGIIALMSGLFSYVPASVWTLIKTGIAISITVMLIGLLKNLVFG